MLSNIRISTPRPRTIPAILATSLLLFASAAPALALSEIKREELPATSPQTSPETTPTPQQADPPADAVEPAEDQPVEDEQPAEDDPSAEPDPARPAVDPNAPLPEVIYNLDRLPEPVRRMHDRLVEAAKSGDLEKLRPYVGLGDEATQLSFGGDDGDPIAFLKSLSGDPDGQEILAILEEVLNAGFVHLDAGSDNELYVWPYFFAVPLDRLTAPQRVELFKIVTAGDYEEMKQFGTYIFYRLGIEPDGRWAFFIAGD